MITKKIATCLIYYPLKTQLYVCCQIKMFYLFKATKNR